MSRRFHTSPSRQMGLESDTYVAYCFDEAVYAWGIHVDNEVAQSGAKSKTNEQKAAAKQRTIHRLLGTSGTPGTFRDPGQG